MRAEEAHRLIDGTSSKLLLALKLRFQEKLLSVLLFGSYAKGLAKPSSDMDFLVVCESLPEDPAVRTGIVADLVTEILLESGVRISLTLLSRDEALQEGALGSPLLASMLTGYKVIYDPKRFASKLLERLSSSVDMILVERGRSWDLKRTV